MYRLRDTVVSPRSGLAWFEGGPIVAESTTGGTARLLGWGAEPLEDMLVEPGATIEGPVIVLPEHTFSHWLLEDLPAALHALERAPEATVVVPASPSRRLEGALELLGLSNVHRSDDPVRAEELVLAARDPSYEFMPREDLEIMRRMLVPPAGRGDEEALYISRRRTTRRPANEPELERALEAAGFRAVTPELLPFAEQVQLFAGARHLVSPHGAGLAHVVWSEPGVVSEIFDTGLSRDQFGRLAVALGSVYRPYITERVAPDRGDRGVGSVSACLRQAYSIERLKEHPNRTTVQAGGRL